MGIFNKFIDKVFGDDGIIDKIQNIETKEEKEQFESDYNVLKKAAMHKSYAFTTNDYDVQLEALQEFIEAANNIDTIKANKRILKEKAEAGLSRHEIFGYLRTDDPINELIDNSNVSIRTISMKKRNMAKFIEELDSIPCTEIKLDENASFIKNDISDITEVKTQTVTKKFNKLSKLPSYVVIDTETTGLKPNKDKIIELSAIRYELGTPVSAFTTLINPGCKIPSKASEINGITDEDVKDAPKIEEVYSSFLEFVGNSAIVGYNASFDLLFLYYNGIDLITKRKVYDALSLSKKAISDLGSYKLTNVCKYFYIEYPPHRALADCLATGKVFERVIDIITEE